MATAAQLIDWETNHRSRPYSAGADRFGPYRYDCSGFQVAGLRAIGVTVPDLALDSTGLEMWCRGYGLEIPINDAITTPGALLFIWGYGPLGHVALSTGDGHTLETPAWGTWGHASGTGTAYNRGWTGAGLIPTLDYSVANPLQALHDALVAATTQVVAYAPTEHRDAVVWLQVLLNKDLQGVGLTVDGYFGSATLAAVLTYQRNICDFIAHGDRSAFPVDGVVGPKTWYWLLLSAGITL